jgi:membrane protease YdiL (CAAX protease family)
MLPQSYILLLGLLYLGSLGTCGYLGWRAVKRDPWPRPHGRTLIAWPGWLMPIAFVTWIGLMKIAKRPVPQSAVDPDAVNGPMIHNSLMDLALLIFLLGLIAYAHFLVPPPGEKAPRGEPIFRQLLYGAVGFLACLAPTFVVFQLTVPFRTDDILHSSLKLISEDETRLVLISVTFSAVLVAPWFEELLFRVILQRTFLQRFSPSVSILLTAVAFCTVHLPWQNAVGLAPLALVLGVTYHRTGSYLAVVLIHMLFNAFNILSMLMESTPG